MEISVLRKKNRSGIPVFWNLFHNGNGKNFRIISVRKPSPGNPVETLLTDRKHHNYCSQSFVSPDWIPPGAYVLVRREIMTYNPNFDFGAIYIYSVNDDEERKG